MILDRKKIIKGLERCLVCDTSMLATAEGEQAYRDCEYTTGLYCRQDKLLAEAMNLLKEQEAVEPIPYYRSDGTIFKYECRQCRTKIFKMDLFYRHCGQEVKWE